jgi:NAD(P)-dependent dehydrogenase (short-subunit alcohol dehydrogenase family)
MTKKHILITGATSGIGKAAAIEFIKQGHEIIIPARNTQKAQKLISEFMALNKTLCVKTYKCDFSSLQSVKEFIVQIKKDYESIDILINNSGVWNAKRELSADNIEETFAVNVLAPYYLTKELMPLLEKGTDKRIIFTSSALHGGVINFEDIEFSQSFSGYLAYQQSKLADIFITRYLSDKYNNSGFLINCLHPGVVSSNLVHKNGFMASLFFKIFGKSPEKGAETIVYLATAEMDKSMSGFYFANKKIKKTKPYAENKEMGTRLIAVLEEQLKNKDLI